MNESKLKNDFRVGLTALIEDIVKIVQDENRDPYTDNRAHSLHEHDTRILFIDRFLTLLGWDLSARGNVLEEARIKENTTRFIDYVGIVGDTKSPLMILEAKAWDKPFISARNSVNRIEEQDLITAAIHHIINGEPKDESPVTDQWYEYLEQVRDYVNTMKVNYKHDTPIAVLSSGQWIVIFTQPVLTFVDGKGSADHIKIFKLDEYCRFSDELFYLLHHSFLASNIPSFIRPTQLKQYIVINLVETTFYGLYVHAEQTGSPFLGVKPQILIYPVLILQRNDGVFITVTNAREGFPLGYTRNITSSINSEDLTEHLEQVTNYIAKLHQTCEDELGGTLAISSLNQFPGFPTTPLETVNIPKMVKDIDGHPNEWLILTGSEKHYLRQAPLIHSCRFHSWAACHANDCANGKSAISMPSTKPQIIFTDTQMHHCAHQTVYDRREKKCHIHPIDERICCQSCHYFTQCWSEEEQARLPCGK